MFVFLHPEIYYNMKIRKFILLTYLLTFIGIVNCQTLADYQYTTGTDATLWQTLDSTRNFLIDGSAYYRRTYLIDIGFDFPFADTSYSQFSATLSGDLRLGGTRALTTGNNQGSPFHPQRADLNSPKINFFGCTGYASDSAYVRRQVFGTAPNRVLVVEFAMQTYTSVSRNTIYRYQVHLCENGDILVVYGNLGVVNPSGAAAMPPNVQRMQGLCVGVGDVWTVDQNHIATHYTNGCSTYVPSGSWPGLNRYYSFEYPDGVCNAPANFVAASIDTSSVTLSWDNPANASEFAVEFSSTSFAPGTGTGTMLTVSDTFAVIQNLQSNTQYFFYVRSICGSGDTSNSAYVTVQTLTKEPVSYFPYFCDFEFASDRSGWIIPTGNLTTRWYIDTAVNNTPQGQYALYVSQDSGATNTGGNEWIGTYAYRDLNLVAGDWSVTFDWRAYGDWFTNSASSTNYYQFMRVLLVPSSVTLTSGTPPSFPVSGQHGTGVPTGWIELNPATHAFVNQNAWTTYTTAVTVPVSGCYHLVFYWETDGYDPPVDMPAAIDNISIEHFPCAQPQSLTTIEITNDEILLSWRRGGNESLWMVRYGNNEFYVQDTFYLASGLEFNTLYAFEVYSVCGEGDTSLATTGLFRTAAGGPVTVYPYVCDFEDSLMASQWVTLGEGQTNQWYVGTAANNTPQGQKALYVSQDGGLTNTYTGTSRALSYAYRMLVMDTGDYVCSFDWRCLGDDEFHYLRAFIVRGNTIPSAGIFPVNTTYHYTTVPSGWIDLSPTVHYLAGENDWTTLMQTFRISDSGDYAMLLMWENDEYTPSNPPAAVDNIRIETIDCPIPTGLSADALTTVIDLTWNSGTDASVWLVEYADTVLMSYTPSYTALNLTPNTEYTFRVRTLCYSGDTSIAATLTVRTACLPIEMLPYTCDFESYDEGTGSGDTFIPCWNRIRNYATFSPIVSSNYTPGNKCLYFNLVSGMLDDVYVVMPELGESIDVTYTELHFNAMKYNLMGLYVTPMLMVGVMDDPDNTTTFAPIDTILVENETGFAEYSVSMLPYSGAGKYIAFRAMVSGDNYAFATCLLDDVELREVLVCRMPQDITAEVGIDTIALGWTPGGNEESWILTYADTSVATQVPGFVVRGLQEGTEYLFSVKSICSFGDTSDAVTGRFRTDTVPILPPPPDTVCQPVTNLVIQQNPQDRNKVTVLWNGDAMGYIVTVHYADGRQYLIDTVAETQYYQDFGSVGGSWMVMVVSLCENGRVSEGISSAVFDTPGHIGINVAGDDSGVALYPNPSNGSSVLRLVGLKGNVTVSVVDMSGRAVSVQSVDMDGVGESVTIGDLETGTYFVRIVASGNNIVRKLVVRN